MKSQGHQGKVHKKLQTYDECSEVKRKEGEKE
jgi:hypothetical protein